MASRNFCDLCDEVIEGTYFSLEIVAENTIGREWDQPTYIKKNGRNRGTVPIATNDEMVCRKCTVTIMELRDSLAAKDAE